MTNLTTITQTMSSVEIAKLTGKRHDNVMVDIKKMLEELNFQSPDFSGDYKDSKGRTYPIFNLPKRECLILVSGYNIKMRAAIIDRWQELEQVTQTLAVQQGMTQKELIQQAKLDAQLAEARLRLQRALDATEQQKLNHTNKLQQIKDKHTKIMAQGSKLKADGSIGKLTLPVDTITNLLKLHGSMLKPSDANNMLKRLGYLSDDGSEITDAGSYYGRTIKSSESCHTTLPRWFKEEFPTLLSQIMTEWDIVNE